MRLAAHPTPKGSDRLALAASAFVALAGCGPSFQAVHEGEARFEQCYAIDEDAAVALERKAACWKNWVQHHTYGQTRDRVQYAVQRYQALARVPALPTDEAMMRAAPGEGVQGSAVVAPAPTSAFAPPPKTLDVADAGAPAASAARPAPRGHDRSPTAACLDECEATWSRCRDGCAKKCDECDKAEKACSRRCVK